MPSRDKVEDGSTGPVGRSHCAPRQNIGGVEARNLLEDIEDDPDVDTGVLLGHAGPHGRV